MTGERLSTYTRCKACSALMLWCVTVNNRRMPLDAKPHPSGNVVVTFLPDGSVRGQVLTGDQLPTQVEAYVPHHRTCPAGEQYRTRTEQIGPKCGACRQPMDEWLVEQGYTRHIGCLNPPAPSRPYAARIEPTAPTEPQHEQGGLFDLGGDR